jgi:hypothetical protein
MRIVRNDEVAGSTPVSSTIFHSADDLASASSDWIARRRTQLDVVIDASQTTGMEDPSEGLSRHC